MNKEQLLKKLEYLLKPLLKESQEVNFGLPQKKGGSKEGIEFLYQGFYVRVEVNCHPSKKR